MEISERINLKGYNNSINRWARFGPYYAMFPLDFAFEVIENYSNIGDYIIDPFAGRGSSIFAGSVLGRNSLGIEINPVGWLYGSVKLKPAPKDKVIDRLLDIYSIKNNYNDLIVDLPEFFHYCYCKEVLSFLIAIRENLLWECDETDATLMSIIIVYLHGKLGEGLSNQMRQTKAMGPVYSVNWWKRNGFYDPPQIDPYQFILNKINWRYNKGIPESLEGEVIFGDCTKALIDIAKKCR